MKRMLLRWAAFWVKRSRRGVAHDRFAAAGVHQEPPAAPPHSPDATTNAEVERRPALALPASCPTLISRRKATLRAPVVAMEVLHRESRSRLFEGLLCAVSLLAQQRIWEMQFFLRATTRARRQRILQRPQPNLETSAKRPCLCLTGRASTSAPTLRRCRDHTSPTLATSTPREPPSATRCPLVPSCLAGGLTPRSKPVVLASRRRPPEPSVPRTQSSTAPSPHSAFPPTCREDRVSASQIINHFPAGPPRPSTSSTAFPTRGQGNTLESVEPTSAEPPR